MPKGKIENEKVWQIFAEEVDMGLNPISNLAMYATSEAWYWPEKRLLIVDHSFLTGGILGHDLDGDPKHAQHTFTVDTFGASVRKAIEEADDWNSQCRFRVSVADGSTLLEIAR